MKSSHVVFVGGLVLVLTVFLAGHAHAGTDTKKYQVEVGVTPTVTKAVDSTLQMMAAQVPGAEKIIREAGTKAGGLIVMYYQQSVRKHMAVGAVFLLIGVLLGIGAYMFYHPFRGDRYTYTSNGYIAGTIIAALAAIPFLSFGIIFLTSPGYYAMKDVLNMLGQLLGKKPWI